MLDEDAEYAKILELSAQGIAYLQGQREYLAKFNIEAPKSTSMKAAITGRNDKNCPTQSLKVGQLSGKSRV